MKFTLVAIALLALISCKPESRPATGGNPDHGKQLIAQYGCTTCHIVPGVEGPNGMVGPALDHFGSRGTIAGKVPNTPDNVTRWLQNPQAMNPTSVMPNLGITPADAKDLAAFLSTLK
jgi:cytochrome c2